MKKEERINELAQNLLNCASSSTDKKLATLILSTFSTENDESRGCVVAANGTVIGLAALLAMAMEKNKNLEAAVMMAAGVHNMIGGDSSSSPLSGLAALLGGKLG